MITSTLLKREYAFYSNLGDLYNILGHFLLMHFLFRWLHGKTYMVGEDASFCRWRLYFSLPEVTKILVKRGKNCLVVAPLEPYYKAIVSRLP